MNKVLFLLIFECFSLFLTLNRVIKEIWSILIIYTKVFKFTSWRIWFTINYIIIWIYSVLLKPKIKSSSISLANWIPSSLFNSFHFVSPCWSLLYTRYKVYKQKLFVDYMYKSPLYIIRRIVFGSTGIDSFLNKTVFVLFITWFLMLIKLELFFT